MSRSLEPGDTVVVSQGEYDDYRLLGAYRVCEQLDAGSLMEQWFNDHPDQRKVGFDAEEFLTWVLTLRPTALEKITYHEWHLGDHGSTSDSVWLLQDEVSDERP